MYEEVNSTTPIEKEDKVFSKRFLFLLIISSFLFLTIITIYTLSFSSQKIEGGGKTKRAEKTSLESNPFDSVSISAKAAYVFDAQSGKILYSKNKETQLPLASLTKLMTAIISTEKLSPESKILINKQALSAEGDSGLIQGEEWKVKDLISFTLLVSSNDGARALAYAAGSIDKNPNIKAGKAFVNLMNKKAGKIGLTQTYFLNPTGLDTNKYISGGYGSAKDVVTLLYYSLLHTPVSLDATRETSVYYLSLDNKLHDGDNTNKSIKNIPGLIASKTGFTDLAGGNLVVAFDAGINRPILISVLGSTFEGRFKDVELLVQKTLDFFALQKE